MEAWRVKAAPYTNTIGRGALAQKTDLDRIGPDRPGQVKCEGLNMTGGELSPRCGGCNLPCKGAHKLEIQGMQRIKPCAKAFYP